jgi:hypothetical protein
VIQEAGPGDRPQGGYMRRFNYGLAIVTLLVLAVMPAVGQSIFVSNDEQFTSELGLPLDNDKTLVQNMAAWLTTFTTTKNILILSNNPGLNNPALIGYLGPGVGNLGYTVRATTVAPGTLLSSRGIPLYDAVFVSGDCRFDALVFATAICSNGFAALDAVLVNYVNAGGNVFLEVGLVCSAGAPTWDPFLNAFGMAIANGCNGISQQNVNISSFHTQQLYGPALFAGVNSVYIDEGENVQLYNLNPNNGVQIFTDTSLNGLYGAWRPTCSQPPYGTGGGLYSDGPVNATLNAYTMDFGNVVSDSFSVPSGGAAITGFCFYAWVSQGDFPEEIEQASVTSLPSGGTSYFNSAAPLTCQLYCAFGKSVNGGTCGLCSVPGCSLGPSDVYECTASITPFFLSGPGTYWLNFQNAVSVQGGPVSWDQNDGVLCWPSAVCPSSGVYTSPQGPIPPESFDIY